MRKLQSVRDALLASGLGVTADKLLTFAEKGVVTNHRGGDDRNGDFKIAYDGHLIVTDYAGDVAALLYIVSEWFKCEEPMAPEDTLKFHVDVLDHKTADISLLMPLAETITVATLPEGVRLSADPPPTATDSFDALFGAT